MRTSVQRTISLPPDFIHEIEGRMPGQVRTDLITRYLYSTDASIYQIEPLGVVFPRNVDELAAAVEVSAKHGIPILPRGSGSSLAGQAIGPALIIDCSRHLNQIIEINPEEKTATAEPGVILNTLNRAASAHGLQFGPDPASSERATLGGSIANNATGAHSIIYGMTADHLISAEVILSDGSLTSLGEITIEEAERKAGRRVSQIERLREEKVSRLEQIYAAVIEIREKEAEVIRKMWPRTWRCASGYNLNYLIPWSASKPPRWSSDACPDISQIPYPPISPGKINLAALLAGSEGTLAVIRKATLRLVSKPAHTILGVLAFPGLAEACDAVPDLLEHQPSAIELIPKELISLARSIPVYSSLVKVLEPLYGANGEPQTVLAVEFAGDDPSELIEKAKALSPTTMVAESIEAQKQIWAVRKVGMGILMSRPGDVKPVAFIEDLSIPVDRLGWFVREMQRILSENQATADFYAHASAGCLHIRPLLDMKSVQGNSQLRQIASAAVDLTLSLGGAVSGEHGDGLARSEWLERSFGREIYQAFCSLKKAADPLNLFNPGKIIHSGPMNDHLRYPPQYRSQGWQPAMDFSLHEAGKPAQLAGADGLVAAIEHCNGAGVCRKTEGVMCPSFQATQDEMHSTRGRANLLRAMISGAFPSGKLAEQAVRDALDLCLACKGCKAECPSGVDIAKLKYEFTHHYYQTHRRRLRDYLFGHIGFVARLASPFTPIVNKIMFSRWFSWLGNRFLGITNQRPFPRFSARPLRSQLRKTHFPPNSLKRGKVLFLSDAFTEYFYPLAGLAAVRVLHSCGYEVEVIPPLGAGRTLISKGFLLAARRQAERVLQAVSRLDPEGILPVVGVEPSEIYTLRDEYLDLFPDDDHHRQLAQAVAKRAWMVDEFLIRPGEDGQPRMLHQMNGKEKQVVNPKQVLLHGHCYQKARPPAEDGHPTGVAATLAMLKMRGYPVQLIDSTCCGMAGAFGYESEHYALSTQVGELGLFPAIRKAHPEVIIAASGVSCQAQIEDGTRREVVHPITLL